MTSDRTPPDGAPSDRLARAEEIFGAALALAPDARAPYVSASCGGDAALEADVVSLLASYESAGDFLETPVVAPDPYVGALLKGRYRIEREIGRGGFGVVYFARDLELLSKPVVVKVLSAGLRGASRVAWLTQKFRHETEALARIDHPGVVGVLDAGEAGDGSPFLVMQYVDGVSLRVAVRSGPLPLAVAGDVMRQIGQALTAAHARGVCHRDLKPENVMLQALEGGERHVKIIDFGVARVEDPQLASSDTGAVVVGTIAYMAPEQLRAGPITPATDVYAMGAIAYELLCGSPPFPATSAGELADAQRTGVPVRPRALRPELPADAETLVLRALAFDPAARPARARDLGDALSAALSDASSHGGEDLATLIQEPASGEPGGATAAARSLVSADLEPVGGAVPLGSRFYVVRPADEEFQQAIARGDSVVLVKGAGQMGKTSLLARGLQGARERGARVILTDLETLDAGSLASADAFFLAVADLIAEQLDLDASPAEAWSPSRSPNRNFERFVKRELLRGDAPVVWGLDEVDRLFSCRFGADVFGLFRSWHNARSLDPAGPWRKLTLAIAYATEAHLFIADVNQSPFNVGTRVELADFTPEEVAVLDRLYGGPLGGDEAVRRYVALVGGHPYLVRRGLHEMAAHGLSLDALEAVAEHDGGPFGDHLRRLLAPLTQDRELAAAMRRVLDGGACPSPESFFRLRSAGLLLGESSHDVRPRCGLYARYLGARLE